MAAAHRTHYEERDARKILQVISQCVVHVYVPSKFQNRPCLNYSLALNDDFYVSVLYIWGETALLSLFLKLGKLLYEVSARHCAVLFI